MTLPAGQDLPPKGGWRVVSQSPATRAVLGVQGPVRGYDVNFVTGYGVNGTVFVAQGDYTADSVKAILGGQVAALDAVSALDHTS